MAIDVFARPQSQAKASTVGGQRVRGPARTNADQALRRDLGITRVANLTGLDVIGVPVYAAIRPSARSRSTAFGAGLDADAARSAALLESIACWHAEHLDGRLRHASPRDLARRGRIVDPTRLPRRGPPASGDAPTLWIEGWDLLAGAPIWVPHAHVTLDCVPPVAGFDVAPSRIGLAAGDHLLEAIVHGLYDVIERDARSSWTLRERTQARSCRLDLDDLRAPACARLLARLREVGFACAAWQISTDVGVPSYAAEIYEREDRPGMRRLGCFTGHGTHLDAEQALLEALLEAAKRRLTVISGSRDDLATGRWAPEGSAARIREHETPGPRIPLRAHGPRAGDRFEIDLQRLRTALAGIGVEQIAVVDLSRPELEIPVVKVVVPGLEARLHERDGQRVDRDRVARLTAPPRDVAAEVRP